MRIGVFSIIPWSFLDQRPQVLAKYIHSWGHETIYFETFHFDFWDDVSPHPWGSYSNRTWNFSTNSEGIKLTTPLFVPNYKCFKNILHLNEKLHERNKLEIKKLKLDLAIVIDPQWGKVLHELNIPFIYDHVDDTHHMEHLITENFYQETLFCEKHSLLNLYIQPNIAERYNGLYVPNGTSADEILFLPEMKKEFDAVCLSLFSDWFDFDSVLKSKKKILLIGPMGEPQKEIFIDYKKNGGKNVFWIPRIPRKLAGLWLNKGKVGIIPFREDHPVVDYVMPLKIIEYFRVGLPCVTYINKGVMEEFGNHAHLYSPTGWLGNPNLDEAIEIAESDERLEERLRISYEYDWNIVFKPLKNVIEQFGSGIVLKESKRYYNEEFSLARY